MSVYFITIFTVFLFSIFALENKNTVSTEIIAKKGQIEKLCLFLIATALILVAGLRYYVGADYYAYGNALKFYPNELNDSIKSLDEPIFPMLATLINGFTNDSAAFVFITAAIIIAAVLFQTYKYTDTYLFSSLLFIFMGVWHGSFNGVRQYFAAAIICLGHRLILEKKIWKYLLVVFIAFLVHKSAIVMVILYFVLRNKISFKNILILSIGSVILIYNYEFIFSFISDLKNQTIDTTDSYISNQVNISRILVSLAQAIFCIFIYSDTDKNEEKTFYLNAIILYAALSIIGMNSPYLTRVNIYLQVLLPLAMGKLVVLKDEKTELLVKSLIIILYFVFWYYEVAKSPDLNNFQWIWQR